mgnify:CR=1 FL=1
MRIAKRLQINFYLRPVKNIKSMSNISEIIFPVAWLNEVRLSHSISLAPLYTSLYSQVAQFAGIGKTKSKNFHRPQIDLENKPMICQSKYICFLKLWQTENLILTYSLHNFYSFLWFFLLYMNGFLCHCYWSPCQIEARSWKYVSLELLGGGGAGGLPSVW